MIIMGIAVAAYLTTLTIITGGMKSRHFETWDRLGRFSLFLNNSIGNGFSVIKYFVFQGAQRELNDPVLNRIAPVLRALFFICAITFAWGIYLIMSGPR